MPKKSCVVLKKGDIFGESSLKYDPFRQDQAKALIDSYCLVINKHKLLLSVETSDIDAITFHPIISCSLKKTNKFSNISKAIIERIIDNGEISIM